MKAISVLSGFGAAFVPALVKGSSGYGTLPPWHPPGVGDVRAPCPMLNSLANHGYLPHDGKGITLNKTIEALGTALNINEELAVFLHGEASSTNPLPNATFFDLDHLSRHNFLEHDASLSRADFYWDGDAHTFNQTVFDETTSYWKGDLIDIKEGEASRQARLRTSNATNPTFSLSDLGSSFSLGETAAYLIVLGDYDAGTVPKAFVKYLFENERLPAVLGWRKREETITFPQLITMMGRLNNSTGTPSTKLIRYGMHNGPAPRS